MSIRVINHVWERSKQKGSALLLLLAIADFAHDDGGGAYPSIETLARKVRMSRRNTKLLLQKLEAAGEIEVQRGAGPQRCNVYRVQTLPPATSPLCNPEGSEGEKHSHEGEKISAARGKTSAPQGEKSGQGGVLGLSPNPLIEPLSKPSREPSEEPRAARARDGVTDDAIYAAIAEACQIDLQHCSYPLRRDVRAVREQLDAIEPELTLDDLAALVCQFGRWHFEIEWPGKHAKPLWIVDKWPRFKAWRQNGGRRSTGKTAGNIAAIEAFLRRNEVREGIVAEERGVARLLLPTSR